MADRFRRPPSFSESYIYFNNKKLEADYNSNKVPFIKPVIEEQERYKEEEIPVKLSLNADIPDDKKIVSMCNLEFYIDYSMRFVGHVFLISIFESIFFFMFVSKDEDTGILITTNYYTNSIIGACKGGLPSNVTVLVDYVLKQFINSSEVLSLGEKTGLMRRELNLSLFNLSWKYVGGLGGLLVGLILFSICNKYRIKWEHILLENLALVSFLGLYELMFFETIIKKYSTETPQEISALFVTGLQQQCGLLQLKV